MQITYEKLDYHIDMNYIFRRVERNIRHGVGRAQVMAWVRAATASEIPLCTRWTNTDGRKFTGAQFHAAVADHCERWIDYLQQHPQTPPPGGDVLHPNKIDQLRLKL